MCCTDYTKHLLNVNTYDKHTNSHGRSTVETTLNQSRTGDISECPSCGKKFDQPLHAELRSGTTAEEYYACPRCLTKVGEIEHETRAIVGEEQEEPALPTEESAPVAEEKKAEEIQSCPYSLGYLRKRAKGSPIPEGCFTCSQMIACI